MKSPTWAGLIDCMDRGIGLVAGRDSRTPRNPYILD
jgi:hypothetical protein